MLAATANELKLKNALNPAESEAENHLVEPLFQFRKYGLPRPHTERRRTMGPSLGPVTPDQYHAALA